MIYDLDNGCTITIEHNTILTIEEYNIVVNHLRIYPYEHNVTYPLLSLAGEVGEVCNKYKKVLRGDYSLPSKRAELLSEIGDCCWYLFALVQDLHGDVGQVLADNAAKLLKRKAEDKLRGDGDNR